MGIWTHASGHLYLTFSEYKERKQKRLNTILEKVLGKNWPEIGVQRDYANGETLEEWRIRDRRSTKFTRRQPKKKGQA